MSSAHKGTTGVTLDTQLWMCKVIHIQTEISISSS